MDLSPSDRLYAIGDIHGRSELLDRLYGLIRADAAASPSGRRLVVHLGDYVDRGQDSRGVIDRVMAPPLPGFAAVALLGNHDFMMRRFLDCPDDVGAVWMINGAAQALESYGVEPPRRPRDFARASAELAAVLPPAHRAFLDGLKHCHAEGVYFFAHAGVKPGVPLDRQNLDDLIWIREEFLDSPADHGRVVVHGHTIVQAPVVRANRIAVDTGAWRTGILTAAVLSAGKPRFLST